MEKRIEDILKDLYAIDPVFKQHEVELRTLVQELILSKPDTKFDEAFAANLRARLVSTPVTSQPSSFMHYFSSLGKLQFAAAGGLVVLLLVVPLTYYSVKNQSTNINFAVAPQITDVSRDAFGPLPTQSGSSESTAFGKGGGAASSPAPSDSVNNQSLSIAPTNPTNSVAPDGRGGAVSGSATMPSGKMMLYPMTVYSYEYAGEDFTVPETGKVYKRVTGTKSQNQLSSIINNINFGVFDINSFSNLKVQNIELAQNSDSGYSVNINLREDSISINPNWQYWQNVYAPGEPMPLSQMPSNESLIAVASNFLKSHDIDVSLYGKPEVQTFPYIMYDAAGTASNYAPDMVNVVFPLLLEGKQVRDEGGMYYGLQVNVNVRTQKVSGVYNITSQVYQSTSYNLETDMKKIVDAATQNNAYQGPQDANVTVKKVTLGTPEQILMHYYSYTEKGMGEELYIPALRFPVMSGDLNGQSITIPLVKEFLDQRITPIGEPIPLTLPAARPVTK